VEVVRTEKPFKKRKEGKAISLATVLGKTRVTVPASGPPKEAWRNFSNVVKLIGRLSAESRVIGGI